MDSPDETNRDAVESDTSGFCTIERSPDRLTIRGSGESMPPGWVRKLAYAVGAIGVAVAVAYIGYAISVGDPAGFGTHDHHHREFDTWGGVFVSGGVIGLVAAAFLFVGLGLTIKKIPGMTTQIVYRLEIDDQTARVERRLGGEDGDIDRREELPVEELEEVRKGSAGYGFASAVELVGRGNRTIQFGEYIDAHMMNEMMDSGTNEMGQIKHATGDEHERIITAIEDFLAEKREEASDRAAA